MAVEEEIKKPELEDTTGKKTELCRNHIRNSCSNGDKCQFKHVDNVCRDYFFSDCKRGSGCRFTHIRSSVETPVNDADKDGNRKDPEYKQRDRRDSRNDSKGAPKKKLAKKNTESFDPSYAPADMRVLVADPFN
eukprot:Colp12_sorted_trinity150504_noHs@23395